MSVAIWMRLPGAMHLLVLQVQSTVLSQRALSIHILHD